jgi:hypothetical protein
MFALNFYNELYGDAIRKGRKTATIRLGDKSDKYQTGQIVWVTIGQRFGRHHKVFTGILDAVEVKPVSELSPRDIQRENPEFRSHDDVLQLLSRVYSREVTMEDVVTIIYFSPIDEYGMEGLG